MMMKLGTTKFNLIIKLLERILEFNGTDITVKQHF